MACGGSLRSSASIMGPNSTKFGKPTSLMSFTSVVASVDAILEVFQTCCYALHLHTQNAFITAVCNVLVPRHMHTHAIVTWVPICIYVYMIISNA